MVQRNGTDPPLASLAGEQEIALRDLLSGRTTTGSGNEDLRAQLMALASPAIDVAGPAGPVPLPVQKAAAVLAALDNVRRHAGDGARVWILLEDEGNGVRVTVRDNDVGFGPGRGGITAHTWTGADQSMR